MTTIRKNLMSSIIMNGFMIIVLATGLTSSAQASEQSKLCAQNASIEFTKSFLEDFRYKTEGFENFPMEIQCFVANATQCQHFAGEEAGDKEGRKEIINGLMKYCIGAQKQMVFLKKKYAEQPDVRQILKLCEKTKANSWEQPVCATFDPAKIIRY